MGKVILEFDSVEEKEEIRDALDGSRWKLLVWDLDQKLRETTKYDKSVLREENASELEMEIAEKYREIILDLLNEYNLKLD